jgi:hypothetical protein
MMLKGSLAEPCDHHIRKGLPVPSVSHLVILSVWIGQEVFLSHTIDETNNHGV